LGGNARKRRVYCEDDSERGRIKKREEERERETERGECMERDVGRSE